MKKGIVLLIVLFGSLVSVAQVKSIAQFKADLEKATNGPLYVKDIMKKKFVIDTIVIRRTQHFIGLPDSLGYHGKIGKVYGPYGSKNNVLIQILAKSATAFNHVGQIFLDTAVYTYHVADSLADRIIQRIKDSTTTFEYMAQTFSMGGEAATAGDLGWVAMGYLIPQIEKELGKRKKGDIFKVWTKNGVHIIRKTDNAKEDHGYALMMRVFL
jgi:hypothetical protein